MNPFERIHAAGGFEAYAAARAPAEQSGPTLPDLNDLLVPKTNAYRLNPGETLEVPLMSPPSPTANDTTNYAPMFDRAMFKNAGVGSVYLTHEMLQGVRPGHYVLGDGKMTTISISGWR